MSNELYNAYLQRVNDHNAFVEENAEAIVSSAIHQLFEKVPHLEAVVIQGYTPSFNDGEPCTFRVHVLASELHEYIELDEYEFEMFAGKTREDFETEDDWNDYCCDAKTLMNEQVTWEEDTILSNIISPVEELFAAAYNEYGFELVIHRKKDGTLSIYENDYDCGY